MLCLLGAAMLPSLMPSSAHLRAQRSREFLRCELTGGHVPTAACYDPAYAPSATLLKVQRELDETRRDLDETRRLLLESQAQLKAAEEAAALWRSNRTAETSVTDDVISRAFDAIDVNGDGFITREEFDNGELSAFAGAFHAIDNNGDGVLSREEFRSGYELLTSSSPEAIAERHKIERAVSAERVRATK